MSNNSENEPHCKCHGQLIVSFMFPAISCDSPKEVYRSRVVITGWEVGDTITLDCSNGYWYNGTNPRICQKNTTWSGEQGHCQGESPQVSRFGSL